MYVILKDNHQLISRGLHVMLQINSLNRDHQIYFSDFMIVRVSTLWYVWYLHVLRFHSSRTDSQNSRVTIYLHGITYNPQGRFISPGMLGPQVGYRMGFNSVLFYFIISASIRQYNASSLLLYL